MSHYLNVWHVVAALCFFCLVGNLVALAFQGVDASGVGWSLAFMLIAQNRADFLVTRGIVERRFKP